MDPVEAERLRRFAHGLQSTLLVALITLRPLVWDGDPASPANLIYLTLMVFALGTTAIELLCGTRPVLRWSWTAVVAALLICALLPAAFSRAPVPIDGAAFGWQLLLHGCFGFHLLQVIPGRERLAWGALLTALGIETAVAYIQGFYVLPAMAVATSNGDAAVAAEGISANDLSERIARGGWFGTFTLSNTLAAWTLLVAVPLAGLALRSWGARLFLLAVVGVFLATRSKGALVAVAAVGSCFWLLQVGGWRRWLPLPLAALAVAAVWCSPSIQEGLAASAKVRLGYWQGAAALVQEAPWTGHGWGTFAERSSGVMPLWAEPSRLVHNEPLEAAVIAGIPVGVALLLLLFWQGRPWLGRRSNMVAEPVDAVPSLDASPPLDWRHGAVLIFLVGYLSFLGLLDGNVGWWPGGGNMIGQGLWGLVIGAALAALLLAVQRAPPPSALWFRCALGALAVHCLVDFNLHSFAVVGTMLTVAALADGGAGGGASRGAGGSARTVAVRPWCGALALALIAALAIGSFGWARQALAVRAAGDLLRVVRLAHDPAHSEEGFENLAAILGAPEPHDQRSARELIAKAVAQVISVADADPGLVVQAASFMPPGSERSTLLAAWSARLPYSTSLARLRAEDFERGGKWDEAVAELRRAESLAPAHQPIRQQLVAVLGRAELNDTAQAERWRSERQAVERALAELAPIVNYGNRSQ